MDVSGRVESETETEQLQNELSSKKPVMSNSENYPPGDEMNTFTTLFAESKFLSLGTRS